MAEATRTSGKGLAARSRSAGPVVVKAQVQAGGRGKAGSNAPRRSLPLA